MTMPHHLSLRLVFLQQKKTKKREKYCVARRLHMGTCNEGERKQARRFERPPQYTAASIKFLNFCVILLTKKTFPHHSASIQTQIMFCASTFHLNPNDSTFPLWKWLFSSPTCKITPTPPYINAIPLISPLQIQFREKSPRSRWLVLRRGIYMKRESSIST